MKRILLISVLIIFVQIYHPIEASGNTDSLSVALLEYRNDDLGLSFKYPEYWGKLIFEDHRNDTAKCYMLKAAGASILIRFISITT